MEQDITEKGIIFQCGKHRRALEPESFTRMLVDGVTELVSPDASLILDRPDGSSSFAGPWNWDLSYWVCPGMRTTNDETCTDTWKVTIVDG